MRIAIPTDDEKLIAAHTGRCRGFAVYEIAGEQITKLDYRLNTFTQHGQNPDHQGPHGPHDHGQHEHGESGHHGQGDHHGHGGHSHAGLIGAVEDCDTFLALGMGPRLVNDLEAHGLRILFSSARDIDATLAAIAHGEFAANPAGSACHRH